MFAVLLVIGNMTMSEDDHLCIGEFALSVACITGFFSKNVYDTDLLRKSSV